MAGDPGWTSLPRPRRISGQRSTGQVAARAAPRRAHPRRRRRARRRALGAGLARETIRKTVTVLAMVLDFLGRDPNPARDRMQVKSPARIAPRSRRPPPSTSRPYRLLAPATAAAARARRDRDARRRARASSTWADVDEPRSRFRVSRAIAKTATARFVSVPPVAVRAVLELCPRDDRMPERRVFEGVTADRLRTAIPAPAPPLACPCSRPTTCATGGSRSCTWRRAVGADRRARRPARSRRHREHVLAVLADEKEIDYSGLVSRET